MLWGGLCGLTQAFGVWWFYAALGAGPISVVSPLTAILVAGVPVGFGLALGERPGTLASVGIVLALVAVFLVSREASDDDVAPHRFTAKVAWLTVGSGLLFGLNFVLIDQAPEESGLWPLVFARLSASVLVIIIAVLTRNLALPSGRPAAVGAARRGSGLRRKRRDAAGSACVPAVTGRCADLAVSRGHGACWPSLCSRSG